MIRKPQIQMVHQAKNCCSIVGHLSSEKIPEERHLVIANFIDTCLFPTRRQSSTWQIDPVMQVISSHFRGASSFRVRKKIATPPSKQLSKPPNKIHSSHVDFLGISSIKRFQLQISRWNLFPKKKNIKGVMSPDITSNFLLNSCAISTLSGYSACAAAWCTCFDCLQWTPSTLKLSILWRHKTGGSL